MSGQPLVMRPASLSLFVRAPLSVKLIGANALVLVLFLGTAAAMGWHPAGRTEVVLLLGLAACCLGVTTFLVRLALRPVEELEATARMVWGGDHAARVPPSALADQATTRLAFTFNALLDRLTADRVRMRELAAAVIDAGDKERARAAVWLHESSAQSLASLSWQLALLARDVSGIVGADSDIAVRLSVAKGLADDVLEDVRRLAETLHPRILDDLGLAASLAQLARQTAQNTDVHIDVDVDRKLSDSIAPAAAAALYRVGEEAMRNALRHAQARTVALQLARQDGRIALQVVDDGRGFDAALVERSRAAQGLFTMRERMELVGGELHVEPRSGGGTRVVAYIPEPAANTEKSV